MVALAGPTGAGKSRLFNALAGEELADVGRRRRRPPRGRQPSGGTAPIPTRLARDRAVTGWRRQTASPASSSLDLPDFDSVETAHRLEVDRVVGLADLVAWVVEPQKYADAALHDRYLRPLASHAEAMAIVLNQADLLSPGDVDAWRADVARLLAEDGLRGAPLVVVSAETGEGLDELRVCSPSASGRATPRSRDCGGRGRRGGRARCHVRRRAAGRDPARGPPPPRRRARGRGRSPGRLAGGRGRASPPRCACERLAVRPLGAPPAPRPAAAPSPSRDAPPRRAHVAPAADGRPDRTGGDRRTAARGSCGRGHAGTVAPARPRRRHRARRGARGSPRPGGVERRPPRLAAALVERRVARPEGAPARRVRRRPLAARARGARLPRVDEVVPLPEAYDIPIPTWLLVGGALAGIVLAFLARLANGFGARRRARGRPLAQSPRRGGRTGARRRAGGRGAGRRAPALWRSSLPAAAGRRR